MLSISCPPFVWRLLGAVVCVFLFPLFFGLKALHEGASWGFEAPGKSMPSEVQRPH